MRMNTERVKKTKQKKKKKEKGKKKKKKPLSKIRKHDATLDKMNFYREIK